MTKGLQKIQSIINDFAQVKRSHYVAGTDVKEDDVLHSYSITLLCWKLYDDLSISEKSKLNLEKILKYALIHDLVEVYAGDVNAYANDTVRAIKITNEAASLQQIEKEMLADFPNLAPVIKQYEKRSDQESLFVWSIDKLQALIQGNLDNYRPFYEQGILAKDVRRVHGDHFDKVHAAVREIYIETFNIFLENYDDKLVNPKGSIINNPSTR